VWLDVEQTNQARESCQRQKAGQVFHEQLISQICAAFSPAPDLPRLLPFFLCPSIPSTDQQPYPYEFLLTNQFLYNKKVILNGIGNQGNSLRGERLEKFGNCRPALFSFRRTCQSYQ
jgi:hypothetical protein